MIRKLIIFFFLFIFCRGEIPNCQKLWDMNKRINGIEIYKMGLYACIEGNPPNLRGSLPQILPPPNITILNTTTQILSNDINLNTQTNLYLNEDENNSTNQPILSTTTSVPVDTTTSVPIDTTTSVRIDTTSIVYNSISTTQIKNNFSNNSTQDNFYSIDNFNQKKNDTNIMSNQNIIIITLSSVICCCGILLFFIYKAHIKSNKNLEQKKEVKDIESGEKLKSGQLANAIYYSNRLRNKLGNRNGREKGFKNRNSWSRDNRIQPDQKGLAPKLPEPSIKVNINSYKNKKKGLTLDTKEVPTQKFTVREITNAKNRSFVPGSPRRRLPTPPQRAPPPPAPEFASKSLANKLDFLSNNKISPKIERIVQKNK